MEVVNLCRLLRLLLSGLYIAESCTSLALIYNNKAFAKFGNHFKCITN